MYNSYFLSPTEKRPVKFFLLALTDGLRLGPQKVHKIIMKGLPTKPLSRVEGPFEPS